MQRLRVCHLGMKRVPSREGGIEIVVEELSTRMAALGHDVTCYNRKGHHVSGRRYDSKRRTEYKGVRLKYVPTLNYRGFAAVTSSIAATVFAAFGRYDVVHIHAEGPALVCWLPRLLGKKVIVTVHGLDWQRAKWGKLASRYILLGEKAAVKWADAIIVLSKNVQSYFKATYNREAEFIPNGINRPVKLDAEEITKRYGLTKDSYILSLSRITKEKGLHYLVKAFKKVQTDKRLVIAGGSSDSEEYVRKLKILVENDDRILFTGFVSGRILEELYSNAYLYVLPSDLEGMPLSLLEAMSYGNCCLTSDIPECREVVGDKAILFKKGSTENLRRKMQLLCDDEKQVKEYKENASEYICERYNWDDVVKKTLELYQA